MSNYPSHTSSTVSSYMHTLLRPPAFFLLRFFRGYFDPLIYIYRYFSFIYFDFFSQLFCFLPCFPFLSVFFCPYFYPSPVFLIVILFTPSSCISQCISFSSSRSIIPSLLCLFSSFPWGLSPSCPLQRKQTETSIACTSVSHKEMQQIF